MIHLTRNYYMDSDAYNFILFQDSGRVDKEGKMIKINYRYYGDLEKLILGLLKQIQMDAVEKAPSLEILATSLIEAREEVGRVISRLSP